MYRRILMTEKNEPTSHVEGQQCIAKNSFEHIIKKGSVGTYTGNYDYSGHYEFEWDIDLDGNKDERWWIPDKYIQWLPLKES